MQADSKVRLDRWLWAARIFKTRALAVEAIKGGRVTVNALKAKPSRKIAAGDQLSIHKGPLRYELSVVALSERRLSAKLAQALYHEPAESIAARETMARAHRANRRLLINGRPSKKDRRLQQEIKRRPE